MIKIITTLLDLNVFCIGQEGDRRRCQRKLSQILRRFKSLALKSNGISVIFYEGRKDTKEVNNKQKKEQGGSNPGRLKGNDELRFL